MSISIKNIAEIFTGIVLNCFLFVVKWHFYYVESYSLWNQHASVFLNLYFFHWCFIVFSIWYCIYSLDLYLNISFVREKRLRKNERDRGKKRRKKGTGKGRRGAIINGIFFILTILWLLLIYRNITDWFLYIFLTSCKPAKLLNFGRI